MQQSFRYLLLLAIIFILAGTGCAAPLASGLSRLGYSIQVGAFSEVNNAERLTVKLQARGIDAFYFRKENNIYAVRFGDYPSRDEAKKNARKLVSDGLIGPYFIAPPLDKPVQAKKETGKGKGQATRSEEPKKPADRDMGAIAARTAERFVGIPYRWGGNNVVDGLDCSGFARAVYNLCGVNIPRTSLEQFRVGQSVDKNELKDGDLVFFGAAEDKINHVGIYVGDGKFVHAPRRGDDIKISALEESYFARKFIGARRYF